MTNNNGQRDYTVNGRRVTEGEFGRGQASFGSDMDMGMDMGMARRPNYNDNRRIWSYDGGRDGGRFGDLYNQI